MVDIFKKAKMAFLIAAEVPRIGIEAVQYRTSMKKLLAETPRGDSHPVLVIPGFGASDPFTKPLRKFLHKLGYKTYGWENGINAGLTEEKIQHLYDHVKDLYEKNGNQKVTIIGWSLGGLEARCMAHEFPHMVRAVISLGSPFGISEHPDASPKLLVNTIQMMNDKPYTLKAPGMKERLLTPAEGVPTTSIYSKSDGIAGWQACLNPDTPLSENIEIEDASHVGFVFNPKVLAVIADRVAQPEGNWKPYDCPHQKPPKNPKFELTEENTFLKDIPVASRKKPTFPSNLVRRRPGARPN